MATLTPTVSIGEPSTTLDRNGDLPPPRGGGGDDGSDYGSPYFDVRLRRARLGMVVALTAIVMVFVSFTSAYLVRQGLPTLDPRTNTLVRDWFPVPLPRLVVLGCSFLTGQWMAWRELGASGFYVATSPSSSFVYLLTGMHGLHLLGGVLALLAVGAASLLRGPVASRLIFLDATGWYWHFMAFLWIYIFSLLEFVR